jgi:succinylarginine dihydrolase
VKYLDLRQSMHNGGGPACLRLRVPLTSVEVASLGARVLLDDGVESRLSAWIDRHYRDRLAPADLADPHLHREAMTALDELTALLDLGPIYEFQRDAPRHDRSSRISILPPGPPSGAWAGVPPTNE